MKKALLLVPLAAGVLFLQAACEPLPVRITNNADRHNWAEINLEREKAGLKPLTWEEYHHQVPKP
jgi:uncharacterized protein YkwD